MRKTITIATLLLGTTIASAQTIASSDELQSYFDVQITDAVTASSDELQSYIDIQITDAVTEINTRHLSSISEMQEKISLLETQIAELIMMNEIVSINNTVVRFEFDSYELSFEQRTKLQSVIDFMRIHPEVSITLEGHTDERGLREYNLGLGESRALAVRAFLVSNGIDGNRVRTVSYGKERPKCLGAYSDCWAQNRRVEIYIHD
jgi:peptidoglycan-associated lipoprotein